MEQVVSVEVADLRYAEQKAQRLMRDLAEPFAVKPEKLVHDARMLVGAVLTITSGYLPAESPAKE